MTVFDEHTPEWRAGFRYGAILADKCALNSAADYLAEGRQDEAEALIAFAAAHATATDLAVPKPSTIDPEMN